MFQGQIPPEVPPIPPDPVIVQTPAPPFDPNLILGQVEDIAVVVAGVIALIVAGIILKPLIVALARRVEGKSGMAELQPELDHLRERVAEVDQLRARVIELEERVDFTERLLAQQHGAREGRELSP